jgi:hypothetical protein
MSLHPRCARAFRVHTFGTAEVPECGYNHTGEQQAKHAVTAVQPPTQTADDTDNADNFVAFVEAPPINLGKDITPTGLVVRPYNTT